MGFAVIQGNAVANIVVWNGTPESWFDAPHSRLVAITEATGPCAIGYAYDGDKFVAPSLPAPPPPAIPRSVTMRQARLALLSSGRLGDVAVVLEGLPSPQKEAAQIEWEYAATVDRDSPLMVSISAALNLDEAALDELFATAAAL